MIENCCAFTGHRPRKFPWGYNEADARCVTLKETLAKEIAKLVDAGYTDFLSGMAEDADTWAALAVLALKRENPALRLHCVLPCEGQEIKWSTSEQERYHSILRQADEVFYINQAYSPTCMMERNHYLVEHTSILLAVYNGVRRSGTGATVRYAQKLGREIVMIDPSSRIVSRCGG